MNKKLLQITLVVVGLAQIFFGVAFTFAPAQFAGLLGLPVTPPWPYWMFSMFGARCFGFAYGMFLAASDPKSNTPWIKAMIMVQAVDWLGTLYYLANGAVTLAQVSAAAYLPLIFVVLLLIFYPRGQAASAKAPAQAEAQL